MKYRTISFSFALTLLLIVCPLHSEQQKSADAHFQKGESFRLDNALDRALASYRKAIEADKRHVRAHMAYQDMMIRRMGKGDVIRGEYRKLQEAHPGDPVFRFLTARLVDEPVILKEEAEDILQMDQEFYWGYILLGKAFSGMDLDADALEAYKKAAALDPEEAQAYFEMAAIHQRLENLDEAGTLYKQALQKDSSRVEIHAYLLGIDYKTSQDKEASKERIRVHIERLLDKYPKCPTFMYQLDRVCMPIFGNEYRIVFSDRLEELDSTGRIAQEIDFNLSISAANQEEKIRRFKDFLKHYPDSELKNIAYSNLVNSLM
ncbi:MAG: tetratricopeptide repeat protein, partial [bacterium]